LISELLPNPNGTDSPFEYVELIATKNIDFSVTPYSVVVCNNGNGTTAGWIAGGSITYGFNINSGTVNAGDVVYVGGSSMLPTGTKIRTINTGTTAGDRFGSANSSGVIGNGGGNADGVAVFNTSITSLTSSSVPVDAIFFGTGIGSALVNGGVDGYQLPVNDRYNGGKLQNSSFLVSDAASDEIITASGSFNPATNSFASPRVWNKTTTMTSGISSISLSIVSGLNVSPSTLSFITSAGNPSSVQSYIIQGSSLSEGVQVTAPSQFEISLNVAGTYGSSLLISAQDANSGVAVYVRYNPSSAGIHSGGITNTSGAFSSSVAVSGSSTSIIPIYTIQGSGASSPYDGNIVTTQGVVTADFQGASQLKGFYIQSIPGDGNPATSDGIFVYDNGFGVDVSVGDLVQINGEVDEFNSSTEIKNLTVVSILSSGNIVTPAIVNLPVSNLGDHERYEGMLVKFSQTLTITENYNLGRYGELVLSASGRQITPTNFIDPNDASASGTNSSGGSNVAAINAQLRLDTLNRILLDDASNIQNPVVVPFVDPVNNTLRTGTTINNLTGILDYNFGVYRIQPTEAPAFAYAPRPAVPSVGIGNVKVASFNVLNYFNGDGLGGGFPTARGANTQQEFVRQRTKIIEAMRQLNADVFGLMEIENDGDGPNSAIADLTNGLNAIYGAGTYAYVNYPTGGGYGRVGTDAIKTAIIYKVSKVSPSGSAHADTTEAFNVNGFSRFPFAQTFVAIGSGEKFSVIVNHFKSKGCDGSTGLDADQADGQSCFNNRRKLQASGLLNFINHIQQVSGDQDVITIGDYNGYEQEDPIDILRAGGLINLVSDNYSYVFDGMSGSLDHSLATPSLAGSVTGAEKWHINADEPRLKDYNTEFNPAYVYSGDAYRSSDHDPVLIGLNFVPPVPTAITHTPLVDTKGNGPFIVEAHIEGIASVSAKLLYSVNDGALNTINPSVSGDVFTFEIPVLSGSGIVKYKIEAYGSDTSVFPTTGNHSFSFGPYTLKKFMLKGNPVLGSYNGQTIYLGGASGLSYIKGTDNEFFTITDRGPNLDANSNIHVQGDPHAADAKLFALPSFNPEILRLKAEGDSLRILSRLPLKTPSGSAVTGMINPLGLGGTGEIALTDTAGNKGTPDVWGIDSEGITEGNDNDFWISEEYGTSIWNVDQATGKVKKRYAPYANVPGAQPQDIAIDSIFKYRNPNKGLEGVAFAPNGKVYSFIQNTILFPASDANLKKNTRLHRFVEIDPSTGESRMFGYEHDAIPASGNGSTVKHDKRYIGDAVAINNEEFLILEHGINGSDSYARIYKINLTGATSITQALYPSAGNKSFEQFLNAATAQANGVNCVSKSLLVDLIANGYDAKIEKQEGLTIINDSTIAVINDNDFGIVSPNADGNVQPNGVNTYLYVYTLPAGMKLNLCGTVSIVASSPVNICQGDSTELVVNNPSLTSIQWKLNGNDIAGANSAEYVAHSSGAYSVAVNSGLCLANSNSVNVSVNPLPSATITANTALTFCEGDSVLISAGSLTNSIYKWTRDNVVLGSAHSNVIATRQTGAYQVEITSGAGCSSVSNVLVVNTQPRVQLSPSPVNVNVCEGGSVTFSIGAVGQNLTYLWQERPGTGSFLNIKDNSNYSGSKTSELTINHADLSLNNFRYRCRVNSTCGGLVLSDAQILKVLRKPTITAHPSSSIVIAGDDASFSVAATGAGLEYKWQMASPTGSFVDVVASPTFKNVTTSKLVIRNTKSNLNRYKFRCVVTGDCDAEELITNAATLTVKTTATREGFESLADTIRTLEVIAIPNPASSETKLILSKVADETFEYEVYDVLGNKVLQGTIQESSISQDINVKDLENGIYFVQISGRKQKMYLKLLVTK